MKVFSLGLVPSAVVVALSGGATGCADPSYRGFDTDASGPVVCVGRSCDAGASPVIEAGPAVDARTDPPLAVVDAGSPQVAPDAALTLASAAAPLLGHYAIRARWFARDSQNLASFTHETILLAHVRFDESAGALRMDAQICVDRGSILSAISGTTEIEHPELLPPRTYTLEVFGGVFSTLGGELALGYDPATRADCSPGRRVMSKPEQVWNKDGLCDCPNNASPPMSSSDCRITDPDGDQRPAFAVDLQGPINTYNAVRSLESSQFVRGLVHPNRKHTAEYFKDEDYYVLACTPNNCTNAAYVACPSKLHPALFAPLRESAPSGAAWTCADVRALPGLFPDEPLTFPTAGCPPV